MAVVADYRALLSGSSWTDTTGRAAVLTYSFSTTPVGYVGAAAAASFQPLSGTEKATVRAALDQWAAVSGLEFHETTAVVGDLTFGFYDMSALGSSGAAGTGYFPSSGNYLDGGGAPHTYSTFLPSGGDVAFGTAYRASGGFAGDFLHVALHEIGHALGLKHPFDSGAYTLDPTLDNGSNTVMAYAGARAATLQSLDVAAIQYLYGTKAGAAHPFAVTWNGTTQSLTVSGTAAADALFASGGNDMVYGNGGRDAISAGEGDDTVYLTGGAAEVNGGPGTDTVVTGLTYTAGLVGGSGAFRYVFLAGGTAQSYEDVERLVFTNGVFSTAANTLSPDRFHVENTSTGARDFAAGNTYSGPVAGLSYEYINVTADSLNVVANLPGSFLHSGGGFDALDVSAAGGVNVLDGGTNSNFLVGGRGSGSRDTFFVDDRGAPSDIWSTIVNFHAGDAATVFGVTPTEFRIEWFDGQGAAGYTGLTLHASAAGRATASLTLAGFTTADLSNGKLSTSFGTVEDSPYLYVVANAAAGADDWMLS